MTLADRIEARIRAIPASNPGYISMRKQTLGDILEHRLLRHIAEEAASEAMSPALPSQDHAK